MKIKKMCNYFTQRMLGRVFRARSATILQCHFVKASGLFDLFGRGDPAPTESKILCSLLVPISGTNSVNVCYINLILTWHK